VVGDVEGRMKYISHYSRTPSVTAHRGIAGPYFRLDYQRIRSTANGDKYTFSGFRQRPVVIDIFTPLGASPKSTDSPHLHQPVQRKMYSSTGISLQDLLQKHGMMAPDDDEDDEMISSADYPYGAGSSPKAPTEILPQLADPGWIQKERAMGKVSS
jgi:hypothetical protein